MLSRRPTERHSPMFFTAERPVCVPYKRKGTIPDRLIPKKVGSKSARRERVYKRAAETQRDFFRRGGTTERAFAARNAAASDTQSVTTSGIRPRFLPRLLLCDFVFLRPLIHINKSFFIADKIENVIAPKQQTRCHVIYNPSVAFDCNNI